MHVGHKSPAMGNYASFCFFLSFRAAAAATQVDQYKCSDSNLPIGMQIKLQWALIKKRTVIRTRPFNCTAASSYKDCTNKLWSPALWSIWHIYFALFAVAQLYLSTDNDTNYDAKLCICHSDQLWKIFRSTADFGSATHCRIISVCIMVNNKDHYVRLMALDLDLPTSLPVQRPVTQMVRRRNCLEGTNQLHCDNNRLLHFNSVALSIGV